METESLKVTIPIQRTVFLRSYADIQNGVHCTILEGWVDGARVSQLHCMISPLTHINYQSLMNTHKDRMLKDITEYLKQKLEEIVL